MSLGSGAALSSLAQESCLDGSGCPGGTQLVPFTEPGGWQSAKKKGEKIYFLEPKGNIAGMQK